MAKRPRKTTRSRETTSAAATWTSGETALSKLSKSEWTSRLGLKVRPKVMAATRQLNAAAQKHALAVGAAPALPGAVDWRNNGGNYITPIKDQSSCGSCVAFATIGTLESRVNIACQTPSAARNYSEAFLFYCGCGACCGTGWYFEPALDFCRERGVAMEVDFPYTPGNQPCKPNVSPALHIDSYTTLASTIDRKSAIANQGPVIAGMAVYADFLQYKSGIYRHTSGGLLGYHAVSVIGYDDGNGCWICKNSWSTGWGESGFFRIAYGQAEMETSFLFYSPSVTCPAGAKTAQVSLDDLLRLVEQRPGLKVQLSH